MRLYAFTGLHYALDSLPAGELAAPPYDQIDNELRDQLQSISPHHFTHLSQPLPRDGHDAYESAARLHREWLEQGVIQRDPEPAIYPYVIEFPDGERRLGVCGLVRLEEPGSPVIRPHEHTIEKPLADRLALLTAMRVDLEPALLLSDDAGDLDRLIRDDVEGVAPEVDHRDADGHRHLLYRVTDPRRIARYREVLARGGGAIADGHHRYKVAQRFAREQGAAADTPAAAKLAVITSLESPALTIDPIHRALGSGIDLSALDGVAGERQAWQGGSGAELARAVAEAPQPALGVWLAGRQPEIWRLDPSAAPADTPDGARDLSVVLLHEVVFRALGLGPASATDGTVLYRSDPTKLYRMIDSGEAAAGFWLPPMTPQAFAAAIAEGDMLPPKSTRFLPKVMSGLVWADHEAELG